MDRIIAGVREMADIASQTSNVSLPIMEEISAELETLVGRSEEQHEFIDAMGNDHSEGYTSSSAARESVVELFPPESLLYHSCLTSPLVYVNLRSILNRNCITVARRQGLAVYQAVSSAIYENNETLRTTANQMMSEWRHSRSEADSTATTTDEASVGVVQQMTLSLPGDALTRPKNVLPSPKSTVAY